VAKTQQQAGTDPAPELLAAVVLHTLVTNRRQAMTVNQVARACERNPRDPADTDEVEAALQVLLDDGLAECENERYRPTRAAVRATELSF
jgi:hypothetical protein